MFCGDLLLKEVVIGDGIMYVWYYNLYLVRK